VLNPVRDTIARPPVEEVVRQQDREPVGLGVEVLDRLHEPSGSRSIAERRSRPWSTAVRCAATMRWSSNELRAKKNVANASAIPPISAITPKNSVTRVLRRVNRRRAMRRSVARPNQGAICREMHRCR
jgi:hypothetical protein